MRDFNFFEPYVGKKKRPTGKQLVINGLVILAITSLVFAPVFNIYRINKMKKNSMNVTSTAILSPEKEAKIKQIEEAKKEIETMREKRRVLEDMIGKLNSEDTINDLLISTITNVLPDGLFLQSIVIHPERVDLQGAAKNKVIIAEFEKNLRDIEEFYDIYIPSITLEDTYFSFSITFKIKGGTSDEID